MNPFKSALQVLLQAAKRDEQPQFSPRPGGSYINNMTPQQGSNFQEDDFEFEEGGEYNGPQGNIRRGFLSSRVPHQEDSFRPSFPQLAVRGNPRMQMNMPRQQDDWTSTDQLQSQNFNRGQTSQHGFRQQGGVPQAPYLQLPFGVGGYQGSAPGQAFSPELRKRIR